MSEIKQSNFRISVESADAFRHFCEEQGYNQAQGFDHLIQVLELNRAKSAIEGRLTEITTFEEYIKKILDAYLNSLQIAQDTEERVREEFKTDIRLRDNAIEANEKMIAEKASQITELMAEKDKALKAAHEAFLEADNEKSRYASAKELTEETKKINTMLASKLTDAENKLDGFDELKKSEEAAQKMIITLEHEKQMTQAEMSHFTNTIAKLQSDLKTAQSELSDRKDIEASLRSEITSLKRDIQENQRTFELRLAEQKKEYEQVRELAVERSIIKTEKAMQDQIAILRDEKTRLQVQIELLHG